MPPRAHLRRIVAFVLLAAPSTFAADSPPEPIRYTLRFPAPSVALRRGRGRRPDRRASAEVELYMAVWTPGSYLVREYARNVEAVAAKVARRQAPGRRQDPQEPLEGRHRRRPGVTVSYRVYCREMGVQTSWVDGGFALLNGAGTFLTLGDRKPRGARGHPGPAAGLAPRRSPACPPPPDGQPHRYLAPDFDTLVDCPIYARATRRCTSSPSTARPHYLVNEGEGGVWDGPRSARDVEAIVKAARNALGVAPV